MKSDYQSKREARYSQVAELPLGTTWERREPVRPASLDVDVFVPVSIALVFGFAVFVFTKVYGLDWRSSALAGVGVFLVALLLLVYGSLASQVVVETVQALGDERTDAKPRRDANLETVSVEVIDKRNSRIDYCELPVSAEELREVARAVLVLGHNFSRDELAGKAAVISHSQYRKLSAAMVERGLLHALSGNRRELSSAGRALLKSLVK